MEHGRLRHVGDGALQAGDRRGDAPLAFEQHGGVVVDVGERREALDKVAVKRQRAGAVARTLALVRLREQSAHFVGGRCRGGLGGIGRSRSGLTHERMASAAEGNRLIVAKRT